MIWILLTWLLFVNKVDLSSGLAGGLLGYALKESKSPLKRITFETLMGIDIYPLLQIKIYL